MAEIAERPTVKNLARRFLRHENAVLVIVLIALIGAMAGVTKGLTARRDNVMNILLQSSIRGVASVGQAFVVLSAGIDISIGGVGLICASLGASLMTQIPELNIVGHPVSIYAAMPIMLLVGASWGVANGSLVSRVGVPALIVTLGMWQICKGAAFRLSLGKMIHELPEGLAFFGLGDVAGVPVPTIIFIAVAVTAYFVINHTTFGKSVYAVGGNPLSAWLCGINIKNIRFMVYVISGLLAGLAGLIMTARSMSSSMATLKGLELDSIAAVFIGGVSLTGGIGTLTGVIIGVFIIGVINNGMSVLGANIALQSMAKGAIIFTAVAIDYLRRR